MVTTTKRRKWIFDEERRPDRSRACFEGIVGIVGSETASFAQFKGVGTIVAGVVDSEMEAGDSEDSEMVGNNGSVVKISQTRD